jgi:endothelin-converting enzyme/putative endopeptidase
MPRALRPSTLAALACAAACALAGPALAATGASAPAASLAVPPAAPPAPAASAGAAPGDATATPLTSLPYTPGLDVTAMDPSANACEDFYQYTCGGWMKRNPIPSDEKRWDVYSKMADENRRFLWGILDGLARTSGPRTPTQVQLGDMFAACMDEPAIEARGAAPLKALLAPVEAMTSKKDLPAVLAALHLASGDDILFAFGSQQDYADSTQVIAAADAGGLGLPDRDYYVDMKSADFRKQRAEYQAHVARMFVLLGDTPDAAKREAAAVMSIETALAKATLTRVQQRDPRQLFHKMDPHQLQALTPSFDWDAYLKGVDLAGTPVFNVSQPRFYRAVDATLKARSLDDLKAYLRWHVAHFAAPYLSKPFVDENFAYFSHTLNGVPEQPPRWKRCVRHADDQLGEALGQEFVARSFSPEMKASAIHMTRQIEDAMQHEIEHLDWMTPATKQKALEKLHAIVNKFGYPDKWRDYSSITIKSDDFFGNSIRAKQFESRRQLAKIGKPLDRGEWGMTPQTVNAYYNPQMNDINFPAGVLQPPLFDPKMDAAPNYGNTGGTIGHELTHGFDDEGRHFDGAGNLKNWWAKSDEKAFEQRTQCLVDQYGKYVVVDDIHINSRLTLGEDLADFGGLVLAIAAWKAETAAHPDEARDGLEPMQRFFIGMAQWACENARPEELRVTAATDEHSPAKYRVNGLVANFPEFEKAFHCKPGQPMAPVKRCSVW